MTSFEIFISYRRDNGEFLGKIFHDKLTEMGYKVFYDVDSLKSGEFIHQIEETIKGCNDFLLLLTPGALDRCREPNDFVRKEICLALEYNKNIIPIITRGFEWPATLPSEISQLKNYESIITTNEYIDDQISRLCKKFLLSTPVSLISYTPSNKVYCKIPFKPFHKCKSISDTRGQNYLMAGIFDVLHKRIEIPSFSIDPTLAKPYDKDLKELRSKVTALRGYRDSAYFYSAYVFFILSNIIRMPEDVEIDLRTMIAIIADIIDMTPDEVFYIFHNIYYKGKFYQLLKDDYINRYPLPIDVLRENAGKGGMGEQFEQYTMLFLDCMLDTHLFFKKYIHNEMFTQELRFKMLSYSKPFYKKKIYPSRFMQEKIRYIYEH